MAFYAKIQLKQRLPPVEIGFAMCKTPQGGLVAGPMSSGTHNRVEIPVSCPIGSRFTGLYHTHPGGVALPSRTDLDSARKVGAKALCISSDTETRCQKMGMRKR